MLRIIFHRALSLQVASAVLLASLPYVSFAHRHADDDADHSHSHHHHGHGHHHHHGNGTTHTLNSQQLVHCHVYWWGFQLTLPGSPLDPDQEPDLSQFVTYSVPPSAVAFVPDATLKLIGDVDMPVAGPEALAVSACAASMANWQIPLPIRLCDSARRARSGVLLV